ncbi:MAG: hypothetical protein QY323_03210 [Patescibacteria group bacterium]|nr:MAG: hypothetical protein QY323_03210 [Patescibacteria group bacterium]
MTDWKIVEAIKQYATRCDGVDCELGNWYVGIAANPRKRLFEDHGVAENGAWIFNDAGHDQHARDTETYLLDQGFDGGSGGGDGTTTYVYAFRKTSSTKR